MTGFRAGAPAVLGTDFLCAVLYFMAQALMVPDAADPLPLDGPEAPRAEIRVAWPSTLDHDPGEEWLKALIVEALTR